MSAELVCPTGLELAAFAAGALGECALESVETHIARCDACLDQVAELAGASTPRRTHARPRALPNRGDRVGRYLVLAVVGRGASGIVYAAWDPELERRVALKLIAEAPDDLDAAVHRERLLAEARALARMRHPNVVTIHDVGSLDNDVYVAMDLVDGTTLRQWSRAPGRTWREIAGVCLAAGRGLAAAHAVGLVHRDFKPDNVIVTDDASVKVVDFGLARLLVDTRAATPVEFEPRRTLDERITTTGARPGTPAYMAPEQLAGAPASFASDQFSFCATLFECVFGGRPFTGDGVEELIADMRRRRIERGPATDRNDGRPRVPVRLRRILARGLALDPADRWPDLAAVLRELERLLARRRNVVLAVAASAVALAVAAVRVSEPEPCGDAEHHLVGIWDSERRAAFEAVIGDQTFGVEDSLGGRVDRFFAAWTGARTDACRATRVYGEQSEADMALRMECLDADLAAADALLREFVDGEAREAARAASVVSALPDVRHCQDLGLLRTRRDRRGPVQPQSAELAARLDVARALAVATVHGPAIAELEDIAARADLVGDRLIAARVRVLLGRVQHLRGEIRAARTTLEAAWLAAISLGDGALAFEASLAMAKVLGSASLAQDAVFWARQAAEVDRYGATAAENAARAQIEEARIVGMAGDPDRAVALLEVAVPQLERALGPDDDDVAEGHRTLSAAYNANGDTRSAIREMDTALAGFTRALGARHPQMLRAQLSRGALLLTLGDAATALALYTDVCPLIRAGTDGRDPAVARCLLGLGQAHVALGDATTGTAELREALAIFEALYPDDHYEVTTARALVRDATGQVR